MALSAEFVGIILDRNPKFKDQAKTTEGKTLNITNFLNRYTGSKRELNHRSVTLIYKSTVLLKTLYASPVWALAHASNLAQCKNWALTLTTGTTAKLHQFLAGIICGIPPIDVQMERNTMKFLIKAETCPDSLAKLI